MANYQENCGPMILRANILIYLMVTFFIKVPVAQVQFQDTIIFNSPLPTERLIQGVGHPELSTNATNANAIVYNKINFGTISVNGDSIDVTLSPPLASYEAGTQITFLASQVNSDSVKININGLGYVNLLKGSDHLDSADLNIGLPVNAIFDGSSFIIISDIDKSCPQGFISVNDYYCIQVDEQPATSFWDASIYCGDRDARICTWSEWYNACQRLGASLNDMTNNWEYVDAAQNYYAASTSNIGVKVAGEFACEESSSGYPQSPKSFRCCFTK